MLGKSTVRQLQSCATEGKCKLHFTTLQFHSTSEQRFRINLGNECTKMSNNKLGTTQIMVLFWNSENAVMQFFTEKELVIYILQYVITCMTKTIENKVFTFWFNLLKTKQDIPWTFIHEPSFNHFTNFDATPVVLHKKNILW